NLLLVSAALLVVAALLVAMFPVGGAHAGQAPGGRRTAGAAATDPAGTGRADPAGDRGRHVIGGSVWAGLTYVMRSPYLRGIAAFLVLYTLGSTVLYFAQTEIIGAHYQDRAHRTQVLASMEFATQALTALTQVFFTGRIIRAIGLPAALAVMPAISMLGFAAIGASAWGVVPILGIFIAFSVLRRASEFAIGKPSRSVLFTVVSREEKYKAGPFLETFVYRAGDQLGAWGYAGLAALGLALTGISWVAVPLSAAFLALGVWLGRRQQEMARAEGEEPSAEPAAVGRVVAAPV
ncbi:MAG: hypothetical protein WKG32_22285, partial [Gemmatimonadaceae bacterium]